MIKQISKPIHTVMSHASNHLAKEVIELLGNNETNLRTRWGIGDVEIGHHQDLRTDDVYVSVTVQYWPDDADEPQTKTWDLVKITHECFRDAKYALITRLIVKNASQSLAEFFLELIAGELDIDWRPKEVMPEDYYAF